MKISGSALVATLSAALVLVLSAGEGPTEAARKPKPCKQSMALCPANGCAAKGSPDAVLNETKRTVPLAGPAVELSFDQFFSLQEAADDRGIEQGASLTKTRRKLLRGLQVGGVKVGEGDLVQTTGFIARDRNLTPAGPESVNCRLSAAADNDIHVPIVENSTDTEYDSIVVEPIPQARNAAWTVTNLKKLQQDKKLLLIRGQLFYDNKHLVRDDPDNEEGLSHQPKRFTLWEIHPVIEILVCKKASNDCNPHASSQWQAVGGN